MKNINVLITGGSTKTMIDKVRCVTNIFKGRTACDLATDIHGVYAAQDENAVRVIVDVLGNKEMGERIGNRIRKFYPYSTYDDLLKSMSLLIKHGPRCSENSVKPGSIPYDVIIHSAAVSDYKPIDVMKWYSNYDHWGNGGHGLESIMKSKVSSDEDEIFVKMVKTEKIIDKIRSDWGFKGKLVKFKLQVDMPDEELIKIARKSRETSDADLIVANCLEWARQKAYLINREGVVNSVQRSDLSREILKELGIV